MGCNHVMNVSTGKQLARKPTESVHPVSN